MKRFKAGDRVRHSYLGDGTFVKYVNGICGLVRWDDMPSVRYNMGKNPAMVFQDELEEVRE